MQITIHDHDTSVSSRRDKHRFNIVFSVGTEGDHGFTRNYCAKFSDFLDFLREAGAIEGFEADTDEGKIYSDGYFYTFDEFVKDRILAGDVGRFMQEFVAVQLSAIVTEDLVLI